MSWSGIKVDGTLGQMLSSILDAGNADSGRLDIAISVINTDDVRLSVLEGRFTNGSANSAVKVNNKFTIGSGSTTWDYDGSANSFGEYRQLRWSTQWSPRTQDV